MRPDDDSTPTDAADAPSPARPDPHTAGGPRHAAPDDAGPRPLIDLSRDPHPGVPDHAAPDADDEDAS